jgi:hypothetical protein
MRRLDNWEHRLAEFIASRQQLPFAWGQHDCCLFACDAVLTMTGVDLASDFRGKYHSAHGAARMLKSYGGTVELLAEAIAEQHEIWELQPVLFAQRGDVVLFNAFTNAEHTQRGASLGIVSMDGWNCIGAGPDGPVPLSQCVRAWRI